MANATTVCRVDLTASFVRLVEQDQSLLLDEAALMIAGHANPELDLSDERVKLDEMADEVVAATSAEVVDAFRRLGFGGNRADYYSPANSLLDQVVAYRTGNPITLSVLLIGLARRVDIRLEPVGMPGHFLVADTTEDHSFIDPFHGAARLDVADCAQLFARLAGAEATFDPTFLTPTPNVLVVARMLNNLVAIYEHRREIDQLAWAAMLRSHIPRAGLTGLERIAGSIGAVGYWHQAATILGNLADHLDATADPDDIPAALEERAKSSAQLRNRATGFLARLN